MSLYSLDFVLSYNYDNSVSSPDLNVAYFVPIRVSLNTPFGNTCIKQSVDEGRDPTRWRVYYYINDPNTTHHGNHESLSRTPPLKRASHSAHSATREFCEPSSRNEWCESGVPGADVIWSVDNPARINSDYHQPIGAAVRVTCEWPLGHCLSTPSRVALSHLAKSTRPSKLLWRSSKR